MEVAGPAGVTQVDARPSGALSLVAVALAPAPILVAPALEAEPATTRRPSFDP